LTVAAIPWENIRANDCLPFPNPPSNFLLIRHP
jgi:hypothetical protein